MVWQAVPWHTTSEVSTCRTENWSGEGRGRAAAQWVREPSSAERISYLTEHIGRETSTSTVDGCSYTSNVARPSPTPLPSGTIAS